MCEEFRPTVELVSSDSAVPFTSFIEVEYDANRYIFKEYNVSSFPQLLFFKDGIEQE